MKNETDAFRKLIMEKFEEKNIKLEVGLVKEITAEGVKMQDGRFFPCNVPIWATGAEP